MYAITIQFIFNVYTQISFIVFFIRVFCHIFAMRLNSFVHIVANLAGGELGMRRICLMSLQNSSLAEREHNFVQTGNYFETIDL